MEKVTRTIYSIYMQSCLATGVAPSYLPFTTLNEKLSINASTAPTNTDRPRLTYWAIGNRGHSISMGADNIPLPKEVPHRGTDAALYGQIPFILRPLVTDLTAGERAKYALRREEVHDGIRYAAYYLKRVDMTSVTPTMEYTTVVDGVSTTVPFVPNASNLNPTPPAVDNTGTEVVSGDYVTASVRLSLPLSEAEANELLDVGRILFDNENAAIISEIALCMGVDKTVSVTNTGGGTFNMLEAIGVQIAMHIPALVPVSYSNTGIAYTVDIGATEPLYSMVAG